MIQVLHGVVRNGQVQLDQPVRMPDGVRVSLTIAKVESEGPVATGPIVIAGMGLSGHFLLEWCQKRGAPAVCIERNAETVSRLIRAGHRAICGDVCDDAILQSLDLPNCAAVALMMPDELTVLAAVEKIRRLSAGVLLLARSNFNKTAQRLRLAGADEVVDEEALVAYEIIGRIESRLARSDPPA